MTLPDERYRAIKYAADFMQRLAGGDYPRVPKAVRGEAASILRHYPGSYDLAQLEAAAPHVVQQRMEPLHKMVAAYTLAHDPDEQEFMRLINILRDLVDLGGVEGIKLNWHEQAFQSQQRWEPTVAHIADFLISCQPRSRHLLLMGSSAGWMMPTAWLCQFKQIDAYDLDPLAQHLFNWRHGPALEQSHTQIRHHRRDAMQQLPEILAEHPQASIWFDNMLGQHLYRIRDQVQVAQDLRALKTTLAGRDWGSVHDFLSGPTQPDAHWQDPRQNVRPHDMDSAYSQGLAQSLQAQGTWCDHLTSQVFADYIPTTLIPWEFKPQYWHWLQAGWQAPTQ